MAEAQGRNRTGTRRGSPEWKARIAEGQRRARAARERREALALREFERCGSVTPPIRAASRAAQEEAAGVVQALGGPERVSEQRMALVADYARAGTVVRALLTRALRDGFEDLDGVAKLTSLLNARRQMLMALGLDRVQSDALDLATYLAQRDRSTAPARQPAPEPVPTEPVEQLDVDPAPDGPAEDPLT